MVHILGLGARLVLGMRTLSASKTVFHQLIHWTKCHDLKKNWVVMALTIGRHKVCSCYSIGFVRHLSLVGVW